MSDIKNDLLNYAEIFRNAIEKAKYKGKFEDDIVFKDFPFACCGDVSDLLGQFLLEHGIKAERVCGHYFRDDGCWIHWTHAWLRVENIIIDITGDQFKDKEFLFNNSERIYVDTANHFYNSFSVDEKYDVHQTEYVKNLGPFVAHRLERLYNIILRYI